MISLICIVRHLHSLFNDELPSVVVVVDVVLVCSIEKSTNLRDELLQVHTTEKRCFFPLFESFVSFCVEGQNELFAFFLVKQTNEIISSCENGSVTHSRRRIRKGFLKEIINLYTNRSLLNYSQKSIRKFSSSSVYTGIVRKINLFDGKEHVYVD